MRVDITIDGEEEEFGLVQMWEHVLFWMWKRIFYKQGLIQDCFFPKYKAYS